MSTVSTLRELFSRKIKEARSSDTDLASLVKLILMESIDRKPLEAYVSDAEQDNKNTDKQAKEALALLRLWDESSSSMPKTLRALLDALLHGWSSSFVDAAFEQEIASALLALGELDEKEEGQLDEALRVCGKQYLYHQPQKLLRLLSGAVEEHNKTVVHWAFKTLTLTSKVGYLRFAVSCLLACEKNEGNPLQLEAAAGYHIGVASKTLNAAKEMRFNDVRGGPFKPIGQEMILHTSTLAEFAWATSNMGGKLSVSSSDANAWLNAAEKQVNKLLGIAEKRSFEVKLTVKIYPHENNWYARRDELEPLQTLSHTV